MTIRMSEYLACILDVVCSKKAPDCILTVCLPFLYHSPESLYPGHRRKLDGPTVRARRREILT